MILEEFLTMLINVAGERYLIGVGQVCETTFARMLKSLIGHRATNS